MKWISPCALMSFLAVASAPLTAQTRPDFSGIWRLDTGESRMIGGGGAPSDEYQLTWLVNHREPEIQVVVNLRDSHGTHEYSFRCTTDGRECVNELPSLGEVRRMSAAWEGDVLVMTQEADSPHGDFEAGDRLSLADSGERLVFERIVTNERGSRPVRQVFRKLGPHPSQHPAPERLPSVDLPPELDRVLREYEQYWHAGNANALVALFTGDGFVARRGGWIRGESALQTALQGTSSELRLRAVAYAADDRVGYIVGAYGYGTEAAISDRGMFILALRRGEGGRWLIAADLDGAIR